ncbi:MAG: SsrA-binding protein SmpB [Lachnospiraceae bacterium]|jgi:SsrA-binding protein|nr:SsrA-binding protein SmpB [Lachnospiraceae bacterium]
MQLLSKSEKYLLRVKEYFHTERGLWNLKQAVKLIANNKKAYHDYFIDEKFESGIELFGTEVKSIRMGKCSIKEAFVRIDRHNEVWVYGMHINPYEKGNIFNKDPLRARKLLMHKNEIIKLAGKIAEKGYTLVPLQVYLKNSLVKVEIGLARGKKLYDKREDIAKKDQRRELQREFKVKNLY